MSQKSASGLGFHRILHLTGVRHVHSCFGAGRGFRGFCSRRGFLSAIDSAATPPCDPSGSQVVKNVKCKSPFIPVPCTPSIFNIQALNPTWGCGDGQRSVSYQIVEVSFYSGDFACVNVNNPAAPAGLGTLCIDLKEKYVSTSGNIWTRTVTGPCARKATCVPGIDNQGAPVCTFSNPFDTQATLKTTSEACIIQATIQ